MKILVVDDELVSRMKMKKIMESFGKCTETDSGQRALALFMDAKDKGVPFDFITMDISMPDMDGAQADKNTIISCIRNGCNDYIMKPFSKQTIMKKLAENQLIVLNGKLDEDEGEQEQPQKSGKSLLDLIIKQFKTGDITLPSLSRVYTKFNELVKKNAQLQELAELLKQDPAISSKLIGISNSAFYRSASENKTLEQAISRLGINVTKQTVDIVSQKSLYMASNEKYTMILEGLWKHSLSCAHACVLVSESLNMVPAKELFTMGLLHDIGKLFLLQVVGEIEKKWQASEVPSREELDEWLAEHHCRAGATLLKKWNFSDEFTEVVQRHHNPGNGDVPPELLIVHIANEIVKDMGYAYTDTTGKINLPDNEIIQKLGLTGGMIEQIQDQVNSHMEQIEGSFG